MKPRLLALILVQYAFLLCQLCPPAQAGTAGRVRAFDHSRYDRILRTYVKNGKVDYTSLKAKDAGAIGAYVASLATPKGFTTREEELAFWLNAYNACVIAGVIEHYPDLKSVQDIPGFFEDKRWLVAGKKRSLNEMENEIIRPRFKDPRVHFVLVCAAQSCPPLPTYAMTGSDLQRDLEKITKQAVNDERYVQVDPKTKKLRLTRIMSWYKQDFVDEYGSLEAFLLHYLAEPTQSQLKQGGYTIAFMEYDWRLNDASTK